MSYTNIFGGNNISPSDLSFGELNFSVNTTLAWPRLGTGVVLSDKVDAYASTTGLALNLPPANQVSVGQDTLIYNAGANSFDVNTYDGTYLVTLTPGQSIFLVVKNNSTVGGQWRAIRFGVGTSVADASALSGSGLVVLSGLLNLNHPIMTAATAYAISNSDRAKLIVSTGGTITFTLPSPAVVGSWFVFIKNGGSGVLTLSPSVGTIDGVATKALAIGESLIVVSDGSNYTTALYNQSASSAVSNVNVNVAGTGTSSLTTADLSAKIQNFIGVLTGNRIIEYGTTVGYWFVNNATSGAFTLTLRVNGGDAGVVVPAGTKTIVISNGTNLVSAVSTTAGTVTSITAGTGLTGGAITTSGTINLANTAVTPASYGTDVAVSQITIDAQGRITSAVNVPITFPTAAIADGSITAVKLAGGAVVAHLGYTPLSNAAGAVGASNLAAGSALSNLGFTPINKAGDTMSGVLNMGAALKGSGTTAATTGIQIQNGTDFGSLFVRAYGGSSFSDTGSGSIVVVDNVTLNIASGVISVVVHRTRSEPGGGGGT